MHRTIRLGGCRIAVDDAARLLVTVFPDGSELPAAGNSDPESVAYAHELGYGGDTWAMSRDHEVAHTFLAVRAGLPFCPVLHRAACGCPADMPPGPDERQRIEAGVLAFQRFARTGEGRWDVIYFLAHLGDPDGLAAEFRATVAGPMSATDTA